MMVLITYDVDTTTYDGRKRLAKTAKICCNFGQRVQNSVFECDIDEATFVTVREKLLKVMNDKTDSIRFYNLGKNYNYRIEQYGKKQSYDPEAPLML